MLGSGIPRSVSLALVSRGKLGANSVLPLSGADPWGWGRGLSEAGTPTGVAMPGAAVGAAGKRQHAASFHMGLGVPEGTDCLLLSGHPPLKWQETGIHPPLLGDHRLQQILTKSQTTWHLLLPF